MPRKPASPKTDTTKKTTRKKKVEDAVVEAAVVETPVVADAPVAEKPVKKRGRKPAAKKAEPEQHEIVKIATLAPGELKELINAPAPTTPFPASDDPANDIVQPKRKPAAKKAEKKAAKKAEPVFTTVVQTGDAEYDISDIAAKAYKEYKSTHKRKNVTDFRVYVKPEEGVAYFTVNGEGSPDYKINL